MDGIELHQRPDWTRGAQRKLDWKHANVTHPLPDGTREEVHVVIGIHTQWLPN